MSRKFKYYLTNDKLPRSTIHTRKNRDKDKVLSSFNQLFPDFDQNLRPQDEPPNNRIFSCTENKEIELTQLENQNDQFYEDNEFYEDADESESENPIDWDIDEDVENELIEEIEEDIDDDREKIELINISLLTIFYAGKLTQNSLSLVSSLLKNVTNLNIPKKYDQLCSSLLKITEEKIIYSKKWFCSLCKNEIQLRDSKQRDCTICLSRYLF